MSSTRDHMHVQAAFARMQALEPTEAEVASVLARAAEHRRRVRTRRVVAVAFVAGLLAAAGAGAATRLLPVGTELPTLGPASGEGEPRYTSKRVVVGTGELPRAGRWQMTLTESKQGRCLAFERLDSRHSDASEVCGTPGFDAISIGGGDELPNTTVVFGPAPERATEVTVTARGGFSATTATREGTSDMEGDFYVIEIPRKGMRNAEISWLDQHGASPGPGTYVPSTIGSGPAPTGPQRPH